MLGDIKVTELRAIADICYDEKVLVFSDEIHADLTLPPHTHRPFATVSEKARMNSVTFMSPSKAFNMPGLSASHALIFNEDLRKRFRIYMAVSYTHLDVYKRQRLSRISL